MSEHVAVEVTCSASLSGHYCKLLAEEEHAQCEGCDVHVCWRCNRMWIDQGTGHAEIVVDALRRGPSVSWIGFDEPPTYDVDPDMLNAMRFTYPSVFWNSERDE